MGFRTAFVVFLLLVHPKSPTALTEAAKLVSTKWPTKARPTATGWHSDDFIIGHRLPSPAGDPLAALLAELDSGATE